MRERRVGVAISIVLGCIATWAGSSGTSAKPLYDKPVYDPASKSYFEMVLVTRANSNHYIPEISWGQAYQLAKQRSYNGVRGRLAVVKSEATHEFLAKIFQPNNFAWIGLRYWCSTHKLQFSDGSFWTRGMFRAWNAKWDQSAVKDPCWEYHSYRKPQYMPVAYQPLNDGFLWIAKEWHKLYYAYFVEYPTGEP